MKFIRRFVAALLLIACVHVMAATTIGGPTTGLWAHPGDGGRGFNIDLRGDTMIVTTFIYTAGGDPIWYLSSGTFNHRTGRFQSSYDSYSDGQCFGCPATAPDVHSGAAGPMSIQFHNNQSATISTPAGPLEIVKFDYGFPSLTSALYGEWVFSFNIAGLVGGDWIVFAEPFTGSDGTVYAAGYSDGPIQRVALGAYMPQLGRYLVVAQQSGTFRHSYAFGMDGHRGVGAAWVHRSNESISGNGSPTFINRLLYKSELVAPSANTSAKSAPIAVDQSQFLSTDLSAPDPAVAHEVVKLRAALSELIDSRR